MSFECLKNLFGLSICCGISPFDSFSLQCLKFAKILLYLSSMPNLNIDHQTQVFSLILKIIVVLGDLNMRLQWILLVYMGFFGFSD